MPSEYLAIPADAGVRSARVWVGRTVKGPADPSRVWLEHRHTGARVPLGQWQSWNVPGEPESFIHYQRITVPALEARTRYTLALKVDGREVASCEVTTLPQTLPVATERPFTMLIGSCFCRLQDASGRVGRTFAQLPDGARPDVKILMGDQVYLDSPWFRFVRPHSDKGLAGGFLDHYLQTWDQAGDQQGFKLLLRTGANYFCADDHEFWNNGPFPSSFAVNTWTEGGRDAWWTRATDLFRAFQSERSFSQFSVGNLQVAILDTRVNRRPDRSAFVTAADFAALEAWVKSLVMPGVLVLGQPVFATRAGFMGRFADWNLPDFKQYEALCRLLLGSRQSLVILTGDVHYGRVAVTPLASGGELAEIISSPMALVDRSAGGKWHPAPGFFPAESMPGLARRPVTHVAKWQRFANHFVTLECSDHGGGLRLRVRTWETEPVDAISRGEVVAERFFTRVA